MTPPVVGASVARTRLGKGASAIVWAVAVVEVVLVGTLQVIAAPAMGSGAPEEPLASFVTTLTLFLATVMVAAYGLLGALTATRRPRNPVGWILWVMAILLAINLAGTYYVPLDYLVFDGALPAVEVIGWLAGFGFSAALGLGLTFIPLLFPDGRFLSPRWRIVGAYAALGILLSLLNSSLGSGPATGDSIGSAGLSFAASVARWIATLSVVISVSAIALSSAAAVIRFRRGDRTERQQLKWFAAAIALAGIGLVGATVFGQATSGPISIVGAVAWVTALVGLISVPIAIGIAVLRYRLYEIDRIISRTISWALVTGLLVAAFVGLVIGLTALLGSLAGGSTFAVAGSTLVVFALFQPLRRRIQVAVDRRFDRARYDARRTADAFAERLRNDVDLASVQGDLLGVVVGSLQPASVAIWTRNQPEGLA
jgi:MFS family permease